MTTLRDALRAAIPRLQAAGVETPRLDAELLLAHRIGRDRTYLVAHPEARLSEAQAEAFRADIERRARREPLPYLLGYREFLGLRFEVTPAVLIPRPETETLVEAAAARLPEGARALDVGAGSGCVAVGLARMIPGARVVALEVSPEAAEVAERNVAALGMAAQVRIVRGRFPEAGRGLGRFDAVVSNPPYIPTEAVERLAPELRGYEPRLALDGGPDGLALIRELVAEAPALLRPGGLLAMEVAAGQAEAVRALLEASGAWEAPEAVPDLAGIPRVLVARARRA